MRRQEPSPPRAAALTKAQADADRTRKLILREHEATVPKFGHRERRPRVDQRTVFAALAPHARTAVRMQMAQAGEGSRLLTGALESAETAAFLCDGADQVQAMTARGEGVVATPCALAMRDRRLRARDEAEDQTLQTGLRLAATAHLDPLAQRQSVLVLGRRDDRLVAQIDPLPSTDWGLAFAPRALVVVRSASTRAVPVQVLLRAFDFTPTEAAIALDLAAGPAARPSRLNGGCRCRPCAKR